MLPLTEAREVYLKDVARVRAPQRGKGHRIRSILSSEHVNRSGHSFYFIVTERTVYYTRRGFKCTRGRVCFCLAHWVGRSIVAFHDYGLGEGVSGSLVRREVDGPETACTSGRESSEVTDSISVPPDAIRRL